MSFTEDATALQAVYEVLEVYLKDKGIWNDRAFADLVSSKMEPPYLTYWMNSGVETNAQRQRDATIVCTVECAGDNMQQSMAGAKKISELLNDSGEHDTNPQLPTHPAWHIVTVTQGAIFHRIDPFEEAKWIYRDGYQFTFQMEKK